ncbi:DNA-directed RNA polymerase III subunit RPC4 [Sarotherodon galilaeus]
MLYLQAHSDRVSVLRLTDSTIISASYDRTVKLWDRDTKKQDLLDISESNDSLSEDANAKEDLSAPSKISGSNDNLSVSSNTKETSGMFSGMFKKSPKPYGARGQSQEDLSAPDDLSGSNDKLSENHTKDKEKTDPSGDSQETVSTTEKPKTKQEKSSNSDDEETSDHGDNESTFKQNKLAGAMTKLNPFRFANKNEKEAGLDERDPTVSNEKSSGQKQEGKDMTSREKKEKPAKPPAVPARPSEEDGCDDEALKVDDESAPKDEKNEEEGKEKTEAASDDEGLNEDEESASEEEKNENVNKEKTEIKVKIKKKHNPFMPGVKNEGENRSVFDQLEDYRIGPASAEDSNDVDLMEWWENVEQWKDTPQHEDMTEKEEAKAFALTADKLQKGIRVFNKLFTERAESLWQHVIDLNAIADGLDKFSKNTKIAQITGGSTSAIGGVATVAGIALAPVTMGTSLIVTAVGLGIAAAGGLTSAGAGISNQVNNTMDRKKVEKIVQDYQEKMEDLNKCLTFIKQGIENLRRFDLIKMKNSAYNQDFPALTSRFYEDGAMAGKAILINANEIMRFVQIAHVAGSTAARAVQIASMATGVLTGLFVVMDIYFVSKDSKELKKGAKSEFAAKIREVAQQLHDGLVELNSIHQELQFNSPEKDSEKATEDLDSEKKEKDGKDLDSEKKDDDSSDEDEIDRIKKAIKKDLENREYV